MEGKLLPNSSPLTVAKLAQAFSSPLRPVTAAVALLSHLAKHPGGPPFELDRARQHVGSTWR